MLLCTGGDVLWGEPKLVDSRKGTPLGDDPLGNNPLVTACRIAEEVLPGVDILGSAQVCRSSWQVVCVIHRQCWIERKQWMDECALYSTR